MAPKRSRKFCIALLAGLTVLLGLASRRYADAFPGFITTYAGDTLWAALVYWLLAFGEPRKRSFVLALTALLISFAVEISQLYHPQWLDAIRANAIGALVPGRGFLWSDLACYVVGVSGAAAIDTLLVRRLYTARQ